jgi:hypothetical protein
MERLFFLLPFQPTLIQATTIAMVNTIKFQVTFTFGTAANMALHFSFAPRYVLPFIS